MSSRSNPQSPQSNPPRPIDKNTLRNWVTAASPESTEQDVSEKTFLTLLQQVSLEGLSQNIRERKKYAEYIFWMVSIWLVMVVVLVWLNGLGEVYCYNFLDPLLRTGVKYISFNFQLSDTVLITLITTATVNITAFFLVVTKYLFPNTPDKDSTTVE
ncbi:hypothetical protein [Dyadobacter fanqingshengii]|uniref:Transmembrane protein n=1 Tax=Dyadobacter fanqingshengii TaxID=2906443 RepID=A0A9X1TC42_9BACT|nr:hypothetical protein [Dyadobacter fanqingshengii]MCF0043521.1 hypothetical protein [Dyadobacter fanqingshengii]MCF2504132.1 hypothetical protein [Dyadobacter fanqingshengii]USJ34860.1 hypothetical protein NFI81_19375 [Dyadobacter fanqingshengii]